MSTEPDSLIDAIVSVQEQDVLETVDALLAQGVSPAAILEMCREAMSIIGRRFEAGEAFIPELIMSGEIMKEVSAKVRPYLGETSSGAHLGCVIIGTVRGDVHDIGKDIVGTVLGVAGFKVVDLGADVPPAAFAEAVRGEGTCIVALSCLLTTGFESMKETVQALIEAGLREQVKVMVGGAPITAMVSDYAGADGWGSDAAAALDLAKRWTDGGAK